MSKSKGNIKVFCKNCNKEEFVFPSRAKDYTYCSKKCMFKHFSIVSPPKIIPKKGERINNWIVISDEIIRKYGRSYVKVECTCGSNIIKDIPIHHLIHKKHKGCEKCSRSLSYTGFGSISGEMWAYIKSGAIKRNIYFNITIEEAWELYLKQNKKCALSGIDITFNSTSSRKNGRDNRILRNASLDRIDSSMGYTIDNIQWVHKDVNLMKNKFNEEYFIKICNLISKNKNEYKD